MRPRCASSTCFKSFFNGEKSRKDRDFAGMSVLVRGVLGVEEKKVFVNAIVCSNAMIVFSFASFLDSVRDNRMECKTGRQYYLIVCSFFGTSKQAVPR